MTAHGFGSLPEPPYWAVVFTSRRRRADAPADRQADGPVVEAADEAGYARTAVRMEELAAQQPGFLGIESARDADTAGEGGLGITVSYWTDPEAIAAWRRHAEHALARETGRSDWYEHYELRVARVERAYGWDVRGEGLDDGGGGNR